MAPDVATGEARDRDRGGGRRPPEQPTLPFEDDAGEAPIPYALTARARRTVAPASLPELSVVPGTGVDEPDPFDPRPARARALRRAGRDVPEIAGLLGTDHDVVAAWCRAVGPRADRRRARSDGEGASGGGQVRRLPLPEPDRRPQRGRSREQAAARLRGGGPGAVVTAFLAGRARVTPHAATFAVDDPDRAARIVGWLVDLAGADPSRARLVVEVGRGVAHDLELARWEQGTGVSSEHITVTAAASDRGDGGRATLRMADPDVAAALSGWQDAVMAASDASDEDA